MMKKLLIILLLAILPACTLVYIDAADIDCGDINVDKMQKIDPATDLRLIP